MWSTPLKRQWLFKLQNVWISATFQTKVKYLDSVDKLISNSNFKTPGQNFPKRWILLHNLRIIIYGDTFTDLPCHLRTRNWLTLPISLVAERMSKGRLCIKPVAQDRVISTSIKRTGCWEPGIVNSVLFAMLHFPSATFLGIKKLFSYMDIELSNVHNILLVVLSQRFYILRHFARWAFKQLNIAWRIRKPGQLSVELIIDNWCEVLDLDIYARTPNW